MYDAQQAIAGYGTVWIRSVAAAGQADSTILTLLRLALVVLLAACTRTLDDRGYLYPILPFNWKDFRNLFVRTGLKE